MIDRTTPKPRSHAPTTMLSTVTPKTAQLLLAKASPAYLESGLDPKKVSELAAAMRDGSFKGGLHHVIPVTDEDALGDGLNRLVAVIFSGLPQEMAIRLGADSMEYKDGVRTPPLPKCPSCGATEEDGLTFTQGMNAEGEVEHGWQCTMNDCYDSGVFGQDDFGPGDPTVH